MLNRVYCPTGLIVTIVLSCLFAACTCRIEMPSTSDSRQMRDQISIYRHPLELRISKPNAPATANVLVLYATGDGGWRGLDQELFEWICTWNYPAVGFSSKSYLKNLEYVRNTTTPNRLARDFERIIEFAAKRLELPSPTRVILVGLSRGAGLSVVAAGQGGINPSLAGVVAVALIKEEEHVVYYRRRKGSPPNQPNHELLRIQTYEYLPKISSVPAVVLQSTHDGYLTAEAARALFGSDTEMKRLIPIEARNHRFSGGCLDLYKQLQATIAWMAQQPQPPVTPSLE
jgi:pimeloyl-ACP methyl ester carboxylesterase